MEHARGSEWRRWDLHIHTPGTNKNDCYEGETPQEKWGNFYNAINDYIGDGEDKSKRIVAIGITDYLSINNYLKVVSDNLISDKVELILPNVEMRMLPIAAKTPVNIHCLFNPAIVDELEDRFFRKIFFEYSHQKYSASRSELIRLGQAVYPSVVSEDDAYLKGVEQFVVEITALQEVFENDKSLRDNTIIVVSNSSKDGASGLASHAAFFEASGGSQLEATRSRIYQLSDLIFSSKDSDRDYFLGKRADNPDEVIRKCGSLKGCIHGSDAHCCSRLFEPDDSRYCWIKADPTFNGLKQVIYEPETRVRISPVIPEEKTDYQVIDHIVFNNGLIQTDPIYFNDKLTCIIGGKSTGKSLLLQNLAYSIDPEQVKSKASVTETNIAKRVLADTVVYWRDGVSTGAEKTNDRRIIYIPQTYLNRLSDATEELTEIDSIIKDVILVSSDAKKANERMDASLITQKSNVDKLIYELVHETELLQKIKNQAVDIGAKKDIEKEIEKLNTSKEKLAKSSSISETDIANYNEAASNVHAYTDAKNKLIEDREHIESLFSVVSLTPNLYKYEEEVSNVFNDSVKKVLISADDAWKIEKLKLIDYINQRIKTLDEEIKRLSVTVGKLKPLIDGNEAIKHISESLLLENNNLNKVIALEKEIDIQNKKCEGILKDLISEFFKYHSIREQYEKDIQGIGELSRDGLVFAVETPWRTDAFVSSLKELIDSRSISNIRHFLDYETLDQSWFTSENVKLLVNSCLEGKVKLRSKKSVEQALRDILSDWSNTTYRVSMDGDEIGNMSPGKKALVLLKLLINLAESKCPILIDQPEDDLDNRSVFDELIPFIKEKKIQRQIIVVTHNANVVLGGDAEEVIVANQNGINSPNEHFKFEYRSGSIEENRASDSHTGVLYEQGIQQHICDILEGGVQAFDLRKNKYHIVKL